MEHKDRQRHAAAAVAKPRQRSASFHGRGEAEQRHSLLKQRPRTQPDLLAGLRGQSFRRGGGEGRAPAGPSRVLLTVAVRQSMWPLHVMARAEWSVADLVAAAVELYIREGRRPLLPSADPAAFGLHFSQFSLQSLNPEEKLMELGSRSFFLCPKAAAAAVAAVSSGEDTGGLSGEDEANSAKKPSVLAPWLGFLHFWPLL
ncbi:uncharacterized protein At4g22758 [Oryza sativa Japonica Group]|uniref:Os02g0527200 protein n=3 Tax=Oryza TaxID=4527 RepID=A3A7J1_ORYSJ|nr:uncharacterized protein At4g22758 [Oryza sativa Japonica Group]EAZ23280.1 hypothetical protein OsJ_06975 [Oryza sativa Japonica Group]BAD25408.1 unknown protein [Oryza sativa Japonica Group]BAD25590.1 unknown protein [Oryza sativa Japonica Group]BAF08916.1 Os02g0527200 [Oryza sativa Japonica Group]BAG86814.1 unnamed protein product [Oryza sativa Japonica Group]|eukprot:NP_001047002.1 Os02g0527200 [Oryza sativa Japonica Group]